jgi:hypothetical protein
MAVINIVVMRINVYWNKVCRYLHERYDFLKPATGTTKKKMIKPEPQ